MSLTSILKDPDIRGIFRKHCAKPRGAAPQVNCRLMPRTKNNSQVGTAFDYLLRFYIESACGLGTAGRAWVADDGFRTLMGSHMGESDMRMVMSSYDRALKNHQEYVENSKGGTPSVELCADCMFLAQLDVVVRAGIWRNGGGSDSDDVRDLQAMLAEARPAFAKSSKYVLNPTFGMASVLVDGADADIIMDGTLVDIKTTKHPAITSDMIYQLAGYWLLSRIMTRTAVRTTGIRDANTGKEVPFAYATGTATDYDIPDYGIGRIGIYFARFGSLWSVPVDDIVSDPNGFEGEFLDAVRCMQNAGRQM